MDGLKSQNNNLYCVYCHISPNNKRHTSIIKCCRGKVKTCGGYKWEYNI